MEEFKRQLKSLTSKLKEAENRAELAEKTVKKLQKEVDRLEGRFLGFDPKNVVFLAPHSFFFSSINSKSHSRQQQKAFTQFFPVSNEILAFEISETSICLNILTNFLLDLGWNFCLLF